MLMRRGFAAYVPAGTPYLRNQAPLVPTIINTIEGREYEGGRFGVTANPQFPRAGLGTNAVVRGAGMRGRRGFRGLGAAMPVATIENLSTGDNSSFKVGDQYRVTVSGGPANADIEGNFTFRGQAAPISGQQDLGMSAWLGSYYGPPYPPIGKADASGTYVTTGVFTPSQAGLWSQIWEANGNWATPGGGFNPGTYHFEVLNADGSHYGDTPNVIAGGTPFYTLATNQAPTQPAPTGTVMSLADQLAALGLKLSAGGSAVPIAAATPAAVVNAPPAGGSSAPTLVFSNTSGGSASQLNQGDQWKVSIKGAAPNAPVVVQGTQNGNSSTSQVGTTDASGNFSLTGTAGPGQAGTWQENWSVGNSPLGFIAFSVGAPVSSSLLGGGSASPGNVPSLLSSAATSGDSATTGVFDVGSFLTGSAFMGLPNWMLLVAVAGGAILLGRKG